MTFKLPDHQELQRIAADLGQSLDEAAAEALLGYMQPAIYRAAYAFEQAG